MKTQEFMTLINSQNLGDVIHQYPIASDFLANFRLNSLSKDQLLTNALEEVEDEILDEFGLDRYDIFHNFCVFLETFSETRTCIDAVSSITINGGVNKLMEPENISLTVSAGEIISIVGPTGSGKSRLLNDIECLAQRDTPTQ